MPGRVRVRVGVRARAGVRVRVGVRVGVGVGARSFVALAVGVERAHDALAVGERHLVAGGEADGQLEL